MTNAPALVPQPIRALWEEAARFIAFVLHQYSRDRIRIGIKRGTGARLSAWLADAEGALRRLILIAALSVTPIALKPRAAHTPTARHAKPPRSFRIFTLHGSRTSHGRSFGAPPTPAPYAHIIFPADPILALGRTRARRPTHRHNGGPVLPRPRKRNPLDRWMRLSPNDPDWRPPEPSYAEAFDYNIIPEPADDWEQGDARKRQRKPLQRRDSCADWRRHHDEWEKLVPAPNLADRLDALERAMANPDALITRTARRLASDRERTLQLARDAHPHTEPPRRARDYPIAEGLLAPIAHTLMAQTAVPACDSS